MIRAAVQVHERRCDTSDGVLHAVEAGEGATLLLLHGWPLDHRMFHAQLDDLARSFRVVVPDRRGFGRSTAPPDMRRELDDIDLWIDRLGLGKVHLLGVSQGGRVALRYAARRPQRLRSLLLQGAVVDGLDVAEPEHERVPVAHYAALARAGRLDDAKSLWLQHPMMRLCRGHRDAQALLARIVQDYRGADLLDYDASQYRHGTDVLPAIAAASLPLLVLTGEGETDARKRHAAAIVAAVRGAREVVLPGGGHLANVESPEAFNRAVEAFCRGVDGA